MEAAATLGGPERLPVPLVRVFSQHIVGMPIMWHVQLRSRGYSREQNRLAALRASLLGPRGRHSPTRTDAPLTDHTCLHQLDSWAP